MYLRQGGQCGHTGFYEVQVSLQRILHYRHVHNKVILNIAYTISPLYLQVPHQWIQRNLDGKHLRNKALSVADTY